MEVFDENKLRKEVVRVWGEYGAHYEVFDMLLKERDELRAEVEEVKRQRDLLQDHLDLDLDRADLATLKAENERLAGEVERLKSQQCPHGACDTLKGEISELRRRSEQAESALKAAQEENERMNVDFQPVAWIKGEPPYPYGDEWFIARTIHGEKVVLRSLPKEYSYDYTTADSTYMKRENVTHWMQFPESEFRSFALTAAQQGIARLEAVIEDQNKTYEASKKYWESQLTLTQQSAKEQFRALVELVERVGTSHCSCGDHAVCDSCETVDEILDAIKAEAEKGG